MLTNVMFLMQRGITERSCEIKTRQLDTISDDYLHNNEM